MSASSQRQNAALASGNEEEIKKSQEELSQVKAEAGEEAGQQSQPQEPAGAGQDAARSGGKKSGFGKQLADSAASSFSRGLSGAATSASARRDMSARLRGQPTGTKQDAAAGMMQELARQSGKQAAQHEMEAQQHQQIANRNEFGEGDKKAVAAQAADVKQKISAAGAHGRQAGLLRMQDLNPDYDREQDRQDQQRQQAEQQREKSNDMRRTATTERGEGEQLKLVSRDYNEDLDESARLSGGDGGAGPETGEAEPQQDKPQEAPQEEEQQEEEAPQEPESPVQGLNYNPQHVINYLLGSSKGQDIPGSGSDDEKAAQKICEAYSVQPVPQGEFYSKNPDPNSWEQMFIDKYGDNGAKAMQLLRTGRAGSVERASDNFYQNKSERTGEAMNETAALEPDPPSDVKVKDVRKPLSLEFWEDLAGYDKPPAFEVPKALFERQSEAVSDARCKHLLALVESGGDLSSGDVDFLGKLAGRKFSFKGKDYDMDDPGGWDSSVLDGYAEHIRNYLYTYKPEAQQLDPGDEQLDPKQEHIGPMAQDIEQVNPACVKETPEGVKTVDTARLSMMNAGAIGDLARELKELKAVLGGL